MRTVLALLVLLTSLAAQSVAADAPPAKRPPWTTSKLHGTPTPPEPYRVAPAFANLRFQRPTCVEEFPGGERLLVTEIGGKVFTFAKHPDVAAADLLIDLRADLPAALQQGRLMVLDAAFHPKFAENRQLFIAYVHPDGGRARVSRFTVEKSDLPRVDRNSEQVLLDWPAVGHTGGCLEFGPDGLLYISTGDGSGPNPPDGLTTGQDVSDLLGSILRIDVDHPAGALAYSIPTDNPFRELAGARPEVWAYGLRNPWKFGVDPRSGEVFAADNGWESWEMVHRIVRGGNCGWPVMEGRVALRTEVKPGPTPIIPPVKDHSHTEANSVIGGPVYRGSSVPGLDGAFVYGDYITGTIWAVRPDKDQSYSHTTLCDTDLRIVAFTEGSRGELYVLDHDFTGQLYELLPNDEPDLSNSFPRRLSETGLFESVAQGEPAPGVVPYEVTVPRWVDGADATRWVAIPGSATIELATTPEAGPMFPEGTVLVKQLSLAGRDGALTPFETQLLHYYRGVWRPYTYQWNESGTDATLVDSIGASRPLRLPNWEAIDKPIERTWHFNAVNECKLCHNAGPKFVLGFTPAQLNRSAQDDASPDARQLQELVAQGVLSSAPALAANDPSRLVDPHDKNQPLDDRARSYLHGNCAMCHHPGGNAIVSFFLRRDLPFDKLNTNKGTGIGTFGLHDARLIVPGDPYRSVLLYRMSKLGYARMPYIGSRVVDSRGVALVAEWIRSLPPAAPRAGAPVPVSALAGGAASFDVAAELAENLRVAELVRAEGTDSDAAIRGLLRTTGSALALSTQLHAGAATKHHFDTAVAAGVAAPSDIRGLFETFIPESQRKQTLGTTIDPQVILNLHGDRERGKLIFFSDGARCRNCHDPDNRSQSLGPTLAEIRQKYPKPADLLLHALQPSLKIDEPFAAYTIVTTDGRALVGLLIEQTDAAVTLKTLERQLVRIPRKEIEEMQRSDKSLMPDRVLSDLTAQEAADLFEYLRSASGK